MATTPAKTEGTDTGEGVSNSICLIEPALKRQDKQLYPCHLSFQTNLKLFSPN